MIANDSLFVIQIIATRKDELGDTNCNVILFSALNNLLRFSNVVLQLPLWLRPSYCIDAMRFPIPWVPSEVPIWV